MSLVLLTLYSVIRFIINSLINIPVSFSAYTFVYFHSIYCGLFYFKTTVQEEGAVHFFHRNLNLKTIGEVRLRDYIKTF